MLHDFVMNEPLFETHTHQNRFGHHPWADKNFEEFIQYGTADLTTASPDGYEALQKEGRIFDFWQFVRTTGYGQAAQLGCKELFNLDFNRENAAAITAKIKALIKRKTPEGIFRDMYARADIRWSVNDNCWHFITPIEVISGSDQLDLFGFALRHDGVLVMSGRDDVRNVEKSLSCSITTLKTLDAVMDRYTEKAMATGRLAALKIGVAYSRHLDFEDPPFSKADKVFSSLMLGKSVVKKPLHDYLLHRMVKRAADLDLPVQIHTGYLAGNRGDLAAGDPALLIPLLQKFKNVRFDLFHAAWPWCDMLGAIGKAFPNVWIDMCWMWAMNPLRAQRVLQEWLAAVPCNKIFAFGADTGSPFGTVGYALQARIGIARALQELVDRGDYDEKTARFVARRIMHENAREFFRM